MKIFGKKKDDREDIQQWDPVEGSKSNQTDVQKKVDGIEQKTVQKQEPPSKLPYIDKMFNDENKKIEDARLKLNSIQTEINNAGRCVKALNFIRDNELKCDVDWLINQIEEQKANSTVGESLELEILEDTIFKLVEEQINKK